MYCVSGQFSIVDSRICSSVNGVRRHAFGLSEPLRYALAATFASVFWVMSCSCM